MQLYVSHTSPYGRLCLIRAYLLGRHDMQLIFTDPWQNPPELAAQNPFSQLPVLITDAGEAIYNSLLICQYLEPQAPTEAGFGTDRLCHGAARQHRECVQAREESR